MPEPMIRDDIDSGKLVALQMPDAAPGDYRVHAIYRTDTPPGPAGAWLIEQLRAQAKLAT